MAETIQIVGGVEMDDLIRLAREVSYFKTRTALRIAMNDSLRWSRVKVRRTIQETVNVKAGRLNDGNNKKGLSVKLARNNDLSGAVRGGNTPIGLAAINKIKVSRVQTGQSISFATNLKTRKTRAYRGKKNYTNSGLSVEIVKGKKEVINSAFIVNGIPFARGKYGDTGFNFAKERLPITGLNTLSVGTAALANRAIRQWESPTIDRYKDQVNRQITRLLHSS